MKKIFSILLIFSSLMVGAQVSIVDRGNYIDFNESGETISITKPFDSYIQTGGVLTIKGSISSNSVLYSNVASPVLGSIELLKDSIMAWNNTTSGGGLPSGASTEATLSSVDDNVLSKINRIKGSSDYNRAFTYDLVGTENVLTITHTGTTSVGAETVVETLTYVDPAENGSNVTNISY